MSTLCRVLLLVILSLALDPVEAAEPLPAERMVVDFENPQALQLTPNHATATIARVDGGAVLKIATEAGAEYPNVQIRATGGPWDLRGYEALAANVRNPQHVPIRVLVGVNNPGADGVHKCSVASLSLGAGESGTITVPFGLWHGEAKPLDPSNVAFLEILLDKPGRAHRFDVDNLRAVRAEKYELAVAMKDPFFAALQPPFGRGINLGNALDAPREGEWGVTLEADYFQAIADAGFDSIRLPVRWSTHAAHEAPYTIDPQFFARVDWAVEQALSRGLTIVMNVHHYEEMDSRPDENRERYLGLWRQIAAHYADRPEKLAFELLNEPHDQLTAAKWNEILVEALAVVRKSNPMRTVVVGPVAWNGIAELKSLVLPEADRNLVVTVHYYSPFTFTHQGADWIQPPMPAGVSWTGTPAEREAVLREFDTAALWGLKHRRPIYLGEFGAYEKADLESRVRWTKFIADTAAERRMGAAYWEFCSGFGAYDPMKHAWIEPLRKAMLPPNGKPATIPAARQF